MVRVPDELYTHAVVHVKAARAAVAAAAPMRSKTETKLAHATKAKVWNPFGSHERASAIFWPVDQSSKQKNEKKMKSYIAAQTARFRI